MFRIGQKKETYFSRIVVRNSIDMRMLSMQLHKLQSVEKVSSCSFPPWDNHLGSWGLDSMRMSHPKGDILLRKICLNFLINPGGNSVNERRREESE
jgi:hypothetical protein